MIFRFYVMKKLLTLNSVLFGVEEADTPAPAAAAVAAFFLL